MVQLEPGKATFTLFIACIHSSSDSFFFFTCNFVVAGRYLFITLAFFLYELLMKNFGTADAAQSWQSSEAYQVTAVAATSSKQLQDQAQLVNIQVTR